MTTHRDGSVATTAPRLHGHPKDPPRPASSTARAYLLRLGALHQHHHRYVPQHDHIPGSVNVMADDASRLWHLNDDSLLTHFSLTYPQGASWQLQTLDLAMYSTVIGALSRRRSIPTNLRIAAPPPPPPGYRTGRIAPSDRPVRSRTVEDAVRHVAQAFTRVGAVDPRLNTIGDVDFRLHALFHSWKKSDHPSLRVKPLPLLVLHHAQRFSDPARGWRLSSVGVLLPLAPRGLQRHTADRRETLGHGSSGHLTLCPVAALTRRLLHLRLVGVTPTTPLNAYRSSATARWRFVVLPTNVTSLLRFAVALLPSSLTDFSPRDISACSTRAGVAMAMLCGGIDSDRIRLIGRWRSDEKYRYLHVQAQPVLMAGVAAIMLRGGDYRLNCPPISADAGVPPILAPQAPVAEEVPPTS
ncbi:hypothetical protein MHU86_9288 [Fragilaria crotonensis]|nr:hypothetical protein MHU86_9288 [Fragilaria crotonensis]